MPNHGTSLRLASLLIAAAVALLSTGCIVPQPRGDGELTRVVEPTLKRGYWRYLPRDYVRSSEAERRTRRWPLVVSFHGMKPFDNAYPQACEWQQEADRYGFVVIAPELLAPDVLAQFPVRTVHWGFHKDEEASIAILDHVFATTQADPSNVLSTSWSSGGYMAHYMLNRHPSRFTCLAVRQSNFSSSVLDAGMCQRSLNHPVLIANTQNDFGICLKESREAREWYQTNGYRNLAWIIVKGLGHERTPDLAADFFARVAGVEPSTPPAVLVQRQAVDGNAEGLAIFTRRLPKLANRDANDAVARNGTASPNNSPRVSRVPDARGGDAASAAARRQPLAIRVSSAIGLQPLLLSFSAETPADWLEHASFQWTLDGVTIANGVNGQKTIAAPGEYALGLLVVTADGAEHRASRTIRVLPRVSASTSGKP